MLKIRLQRVGKKHEPVFRVLLTDSKNGPKSGRFLEILGSYDARDKNETKLKADRIAYWIGQGAKPSDTIHNLLIEKDIIKGEKRNVLPQKSPVKKEGEEAPVETASAPAAPVSEPAPAEEAPVETASAPAEEVKEEAPVVEESATETPAEEKTEE